MSELAIQNDAWKRHERILSLIQQWRLYTLEIGKELYEMRENEEWRKLGEYESYSEYLDDYGITRQFASEVTKIYEVYQLSLGIRYTELVDISYPKLYSGAKYANEKTVNEILASATTQNLHVFRRWLIERFRSDKSDLPIELSKKEFCGDDWRLIHGDMKDICSKMPDKSFDAIVTDPPYAEKYLYLYKELAKQASRLLVPNGIMLVMAGQSHLPAVLRLMSRRINYRWTVAYLLPSQETIIWGRKIWTHWKPVVVFENGSHARNWTTDIITSPKPEKEYHVWGQSLIGLTGLIGTFVIPDSRILDPFVGGGSTIDAGQALGHYCVGIDNDAKAIFTTKERLNGKRRKNRLA